MSAQPIRRWDAETSLVLWLAAFVSIASFLFYARRGEILLYGDAVAHINIARRVFDSRTPGLLQLGTVWLPLPHLLMIPFLLSDRAWQTGIGGSIPSLVAYGFGALGIFRLMRGALNLDSEKGTAARIAPWIAVAVYVANPNLIYLQTTAMTEPLYVALFTWAVVYFCEFVWEDVQTASASLHKCGLCIAAACFTRYDGWFLAAVVCGALSIVAPRAQSRKVKSGGSFTSFVLLAAAAPVLWLAYNAVIYRNPLEFANGPYSAKAIEAKTSVPGAPPHPGTHDLLVAGEYVLKSGEENLAAGIWQKVWVVLLIAGTAMSLAFDRRFWPLLLLWVPLLFYACAVAYEGVPIFIPVWWPFTHYNVRYGLEMLPAFAVFISLAQYFVARLARDPRVRIGIAVTALAFGGISYTSIWRDPVCFREAWINSRTRIALERELATHLKRFTRDSTLLMYLGDHVGALQQADIPLRRVINEGNHRPWLRPSDPGGLWEQALASPEKYADFVVALEGDAVSTQLQRQNLSTLAVIHVSGQPRVVLYQTRRVIR